MNYLLNKIKDAKLELKPFPHIVIDNFLDQDDFKLISNEILKIENNIDQSVNHSVSRSEIILNKNGNKDYIFDNLSNTLESSDFIKVVKKKFENYYPKNFDKLHLKTNPNLLVYNGPTGKESRSPRGPHIDPAKELFNWLLYLKEETDKYTNLYLYDFKDYFRGYDYKEFDKNTIPINDLNLSKSIECSPNKFLLFFNSHEAVHSVGHRKPFSGIRVYLTGGVVFKNSLYWSINKLRFKDKFRYILLRPFQRLKNKILSLRN